MDLLPAFVDLQQFMKKALPQEWHVDFSEYTTCEGKEIFIRVESALTPDRDRALICLIRYHQANVIVLSEDIISNQVREIIKILRHVIAGQTIPIKHLSLVECPLCCENCPKAFLFYEECLISPC